MLIRSKKISNKTILTVSLLIAAAGVALIALTRAAEPTDSTVANIWVDTNGGSCAYYSSASPWVDGEACSSFEQAVSKVKNGEVVRVKAGNYAGQTITSDKTNTTYVVAENGTTIGGFTPDSNWVEYQNFTASNMDLENANAQHVTLRNVNVTAQGAIVIDGPDFFSWYGGTVGPYQLQAQDWDGRVTIQGAPDLTTNILLDGLTIGPTTRSAAAISSGKHTEAIRINQGVTGLTLRNMTFLPGQNINSAVIFIGGAGAPTNETDILIENNFFGQAQDGQPLIDTNGQGAACNKYTISYNTNATSNSLWAGTVNCSSQANVTLRGNLGKLNGSSTCGNAVYDNNVWSNSGGCGGGDLANQAISFTGDGYHIPSNSPAKDNGSAVCPPTDHDGNTRPYPTGGVCDAGAHEYGSSSPPPSGCSPAQNLGNINCDTKIDIFDLSIILSNYGKASSQASNVAADLNNSGSIDGTDLSILLSNYGS